MIAHLAAAVLAATAPHPVTAELTRADGIVRVRVVGKASHAVHVRYTLIAGGRGNTATQSGSAALRPGRRTVLIDLTQSAGPSWTGALSVECDDGSSYVLPLGGKSG